jgi:hypothetical protein
MLPHGDRNAELAAICTWMSRPLSREQIVANDLWAHLEVPTS